MDKEIPKELNSIIDYLTNVFARSINSPLYTKEDLTQDLIVVYLERYRATEQLKDVKAFWFKIFKNYLISKYRSVKIEKKLLEKIKKENVFDQYTFANTKLFDV